VAGVKAGAFTCVGWQVTVCDPIRQVTPRSSRTSSRRGLRSALTFKLSPIPVRDHHVQYSARAAGADPEIVLGQADWT